MSACPFWLEHTDSARFDSDAHKHIRAHHAARAIRIEGGHLQPLCRTAARLGTAIVLGTIERPDHRGGHSVYRSPVHIGADGVIASVHRKLTPTHEERWCWTPGDGHGLRVHPVGPFGVGSLNCYENRMPLSRAALYAQGEDLHVALWPGNLRNTAETTRFLAREGRSFELAVSGLMRREDVPADSPAAGMLTSCPARPGHGGFGVHINGSSAESDGVEFTATFRPVPGFVTSVNGAYTEARLTGDASALTGGLKSDRLPFTPPDSMSVNSDCTFGIGGEAEAFVGGSPRFLSRQLADFDGPAAPPTARHRSAR